MLLIFELVPIEGLPVVRHMGEVTAVAGEQLVLTCPVGGYPIHSITWDKGNLSSISFLYSYW